MKNYEKTEFARNGKRVNRLVALSLLSALVSLGALIARLWGA